MKQNTVIIIIAAVFLPMCLAPPFLQSETGELSPSIAPVAERAAEKKILAVLDSMVKSHSTYLSVPIQDGKALRLLTEATNAKNVVEIGTSTGYSGLWVCLALLRTNGRLTTFEIDHQRASMAQEHFKEAGVEKMVTIVEGGAHELVTKLKGPIDVAFIDADKGLSNGPRDRPRHTAASDTPPWLPSGWGCRGRRLSRGREKRSLRQAHAFEQVDVARIRAKGFKEIVDLYGFQGLRIAPRSFFQPLEGMVAVPHQRVVTRYFVG